MKIKINLKGIEEIIPKWKEQIATDLVDYYKDRIKNGSDVPLKSPRPDGTTHTPLFRTGKNLHDSIKSNITNSSVEVGSNFRGAKKLYYGGSGVRPRKYLKPTQETIETIKKAILKITRSA